MMDASVSMLARLLEAPQPLLQQELDPGPNLNLDIKRTGHTLD